MKHPMHFSKYGDVSRPARGVYSTANGLRPVRNLTLVSANVPPFSGDSIVTAGRIKRTVRRSPRRKHRLKLTKAAAIRAPHPNPLRNGQLNASP